MTYRMIRTRIIMHTNDPKYAPVIKQMKKDLLRLRKETGDTDEKYPEMQELLEKYYNK